MLYSFRRARTRTTFILLAVNIVLCAISVLHWIVNSVVILGVVSVGRAEVLVIVLFLVFNYIISDAIVIWRVWLIWERNAKICIPSFVCLIETLVSVLIGISSRDRSFGLVALIWGSLLGSNLWTTSVIAWRAWFIESHCFSMPHEVTNWCLHSP
ncbi:hypothetical protein HETIRDRAFT_417529 [Heterobasidion irregulare TC 32-1]|uniref:Uncharacterized protein n=1 Tax=Heterobasidion irregulare (strain TC 32-1) TaxID=747525 RepID=W4K7Q7_HETIT|nr:uncharacterized protein HETIRDRAFT_417529 [Heterobasidion irregulare TC 32-1]ETW81385.1 hypothetical protein HETIRDRAFT_417529 [Heterobasidion irregulare TC 32-1]